MTRTNTITRRKHGLVSHGLEQSQPVSDSRRESSQRSNKPIAAFDRALRLTVATGLVLGLGLSQAITAEPPAAGAPPPAANAAPKPAASSGPSAAQIESWRRELLKTQRPNGCFTAAYPDTQWRAVPCKTPPRKLYPPRIPGAAGGSAYSDFSAVVPSNHISQAEGSFNVINNSVTSECAVPCPNGVCPKNPTCTGQPANTYSLQLNTKPFTGTKACNASPNKNAPPPNTCAGWEQFVYTSVGFGGFIQYWLLTYGPPGTSCPAPRGAFCVQGESESDGWCPFQFSPTGPVYCVVNATNMTPTAPQPVTALQIMKVTATVAGVNGVPNDSVAVAVGPTAATATGNNYFPDLGSLWTEAEFNVFGDGGGDEAVFNPGASMQVHTEIDYGGTSGPGCDHVSFTGESNNLTLVTPPYPVSVAGANPTLEFPQSNPPASGSASCLPPGYENVGYVDGNSHLQQASYPLGASTQDGSWWTFTDITAQTGAATVFTGSGLASWIDAANQHVAYFGNNGHLLEAFAPNGVSIGGPTWKTTDITVQTGAIGAPTAASGLTSWVDNSLGHVAYVDFNAHLQEAHYTLGQTTPQWQSTDITAQTGAQAYSLALTSWAPSPYQHLGYISSNQHVLDAFAPLGQSGAKWQLADINVQTGAPAAIRGSPLTSWVDITFQHVVYVDFNSHVREAFAPVRVSGSQPTGSATSWQVTDITAQTGAPVAAGITGLTSWEDATNQHVVYIGANGHVLEAHTPAGQSGQQWQVTDITAQSGAPLAAGGAGQTAWAAGALTSWYDATNQYVVFIGSNGHLLKAFYPVGQTGKQWKFVDISAQSAPVTSSGSSLTNWTNE
jgi:hypothetical protein